ncbi:MAG: hypothetical protein FWD39_05060 [Clostridiales bacterium]|nr:hypothetical protein [Clostridiales bacterium]
MDERKTLWMRVLINNVKALGIFLAFAFLSLCIYFFFMLLFFMHADLALVMKVLFFPAIGILWANFYAGKLFLSSTKNLWLDSASFILVTALVSFYTLGYVLTSRNMATEELLLGVMPHFFAFLAIFMQFLGMRKGRKVK